MLTTNDIKIEIINLITQIDDLEQLKLIHREIGNQITPPLLPKRELPFAHAVIEIRKDVTFEEILQEQHYEPVSYQDFREIADEIVWEHSLEELLAAID